MSTQNEDLIAETKPKPFCIIPARKGSKRIKGKNKRLLNGRPLVDYAIKAAIDSGVFGMTVVSSDDMDILEWTYQYFHDADIHPNKRPKSLCGDNVELKVVVRFLAMAYRVGDVICLLQPTNPLITAQQIRDAYNVFKERGANYLIGMYGGKDLGFHFLKTMMFLKEYDKNFYGTNWIPYEMNGIDIDTEEDWIEAERLINEQGS